MKLTRVRLLFITIVAILLALWALELFAGFDLVQAIFANLAFVVVGIIFLSLMSVIGGFFLGMWISARLFSTKGFTPFEEEMLRMREDVKEIRERLAPTGAGAAPGSHGSQQRATAAAVLSSPAVPWVKAEERSSGSATQANGGEDPASASPLAAPDRPGKQI